MTVPYAESETFTIVQSSNILPKELEQGWDLEESGIAWFRDGDNFGLQIDQVGVQSNFYASARRMQHATIDYDPSYPGEDKILTPSNPDNDDGRFLFVDMKAYLLGSKTVVKCMFRVITFPSMLFCQMNGTLHLR